MKKVLVIAALATLFAATTVNAQEFNFGAKGGLNLATLNGKDADDVKMKVGFNLGLVGEYAFNEKMAIQPELLFSAQGAKSEEGDGKLKLNYLSLPVMFKYYVAEGFSLQAGPQVSYLLSAKVDDEDVKDGARKIDFALGVGAGYKLDNNLFFDARYTYGLSKIGKDSDDGKVYNGVFQISVGYMF